MTIDVEYCVAANSLYKQAFKHALNMEIQRQGVKVPDNFILNALDGEEGECDQDEWEQTELELMAAELVADCKKTLTAQKPTGARVYHYFTINIL